MSQPVKLSDSLILDARLTGELAERSIAGQIEFWAALGRAIEPLLRLPNVLALLKAGKVRPLSTAILQAGTPRGTQLLAVYLETQPFPHYEPAPGRPGLLVRIDRDGRRTTGRFVNREFKRVARLKRKSGPRRNPRGA